MCLVMEYSFDFAVICNSIMKKIMITIKRRYTTEIIHEIEYKGRKVFVLKWSRILPKGCEMASEKIFFNLNFEIKYKSLENPLKVILIGEQNNKFWFFKIIKEMKDNNYSFSAKKPLIEETNELKIYFIDWQKNIKNIIPKRMGIEYAVSEEEVYE